MLSLLLFVRCKSSEEVVKFKPYKFKDYVTKEIEVYEARECLYPLLDSIIMKTKECPMYQGLKIKMAFIYGVWSDSITQFGISAVYKFVTDGLKLFPSEVDFGVRGLLGKGNVYRTNAGLDVLPALAGVGYICGPKIASYLFSGGVMSWFVLIPAIIFFGGTNISNVMDAAGNAMAFNGLDPWQVWSNYIKYIGAGAVAAGGIISLFKTFPTMIRTFQHC
jgi:hypothetical protein